MSLLTRIEKFKAYLFILIDNCVNDGVGTKANEGGITLQFPSRFEDKYRINLDLYVFGPRRHYTYVGDSFEECFDQLQTDVALWWSQELRERKLGS